MNGDGRSDIVHGHWYVDHTVIDLFYSRGSHSHFEERTHTHPHHLGWSPSLIIDLDGDGRSELVDTGWLDGPLRFFFFDRKSHQRSVHKIANGMGATTEFRYGYMTEPSVHTRGTAFAYPHGDTQLPLELVKDVSIPNGLGGYNSTSYAYGGAVLNRTGRGFVGFKLGYSVDVTSNTLSVNQSTAHEAYSELYPASSQVYRADEPTQLLSNTVYGYEFLPVGVPALLRHLTKLTATIGANIFTGTTTTMLNTGWDAYGNVTSSTTNVNGIELINTTTNYTAAWPSTIPGIPQDITVDKTRTPAPTVTAKTHFEYDPANGHPLRTTAFHGTPGELTTDYTYHPAGTVHTKITHYPGQSTAEQPSEWFQYEPKYRFATEHSRVWVNNGSPIDVVQQVTTDPKWGKPLSTLSSDGLTTLFKYDAFGRLNETWVPHIAGTVRYAVLTSMNWNVDNYLQFFNTITTDPGGPDQVVIHDLLNRPLISRTEGFNNNWIYTSREYDERGNVGRETTPHRASEDFLLIGHFFDPYDRLIRDVHPLSGNTDYVYDYSGGELTTTITGAGQWSRATTDATGKTVLAADDGGKVKYTYDSWGNLLTAMHDGFYVARNKYDMYGRQTELNLPNAGITRYRYNPLGQLEWQKDANGNEVTNTYDNLGRPKMRTGTEGVTEYTYYNVNGRMNDNPVLVHGPTVYRTFGYNDPYNRLTKSTSNIAGQSYETRYEYDAYDRVAKQIHQTGLEVKNEYAADGSLWKVETVHGVLFKGAEKNGLGQFTAYTMGDGTIVKKAYHHGYLTAISAGEPQELRMGYDYHTGNMNYRWDQNKGRKETYTYDELNRLTSSLVQSVDESGTETGTVSTNTYGYDGSIGSTRGNLAQRTDIGNFGYASQAVVAAVGASYPTPPNDPALVISHETQTLTYTPFLKTKSIAETVAGEAYLLNYEYGPELQRTRSLLTRNGLAHTERIYVGGFEKQIKDGATELIHYIPGGDGLCAIVVKTGNTWKTYSIYTDHLGSIVAVTDILDASIVAEQNFDPWGRHRNPTTWASDDEPELPTWLYRGFTGHEHVSPFMLINMNGRMYDPLNGRMMGADNYVQSGLGTQGYNRFSYAGNNPLRYTDPSGEYLAGAFMVMSVFADFTSNLINQHSDALGSAYRNTMASMNGMSGALTVYSYSVGNTTISLGLSPFGFGPIAGISHQFGDFTLGLNGGGAGSFLSANVGYSDGNFSAGLSFGRGPDGSVRLGGGVGYKGVTIGITRFGGKDPQWNWIAGYSKGDFRFMTTNDFLVGGDEYRTAAAEIGWGQASFGVNLYTTSPPELEYDKRPNAMGSNGTYRSRWGANKFGTYSSGSRVHAGM